MTIAIDVREACVERKTGKGQWTYALLQELLTRSGYSFVLYTDAPLPLELKQRADQPSVEVRHISARGLRWHVRVWRDLRRSAIDVYLSPVSFIVPFLLGSRMRVIPVVHDLIAFRHEPHDRKAQFIERLTLGRAMRTAYSVATVSTTTKEDLLARYPWLNAARVTPVFAGPVQLVEAADPQKTIVCIGTLCPRKNQLGLIRAFASLSDQDRSEYSLILIGGRGWNDQEIIDAAKKTPHVEWKQYLPTDQLETMLSHAGILALPSLYEGFGLPVLEAMHAGVPVLTSNVGSTKEIAGDAAVLVDPLDDASIAQGLRELIHNEPLRSRCIERGKKRAKLYTWPKTVDTLCSLFPSS